MRNVQYNAASNQAGIPCILAARHARASAQATRIHLLHWPNFIPEADVELRRQITVQGMAAEDAVRWAEGELKRIYEA